MRLVIVKLVEDIKTKKKKKKKEEKKDELDVKTIKNYIAISAVLLFAVMKQLGQLPQPNIFDDRHLPVYRWTQTKTVTTDRPTLSEDPESGLLEMHR